LRRLPARPDIPEATRIRLQAKTAEILAEADGDTRQRLARQLYDAARPTAWFEPVIAALRGISGVGQFCMYCSANEPSEVEHFRPLAVFPQDTFEYNNYLWVCGICNRNYKGNKFPPVNHPGEPILNPLDDDVWAYFFLDTRFGRLLKRIDAITEEPLPRAVSTCEVVGIDRENIQLRRTHRYRSLVRNANRTLGEWRAGTLTVDALRNEVSDWRSEAFQIDVADYFLNGPGRSKEPFKSILIAAGEIAEEEGA
jgi:hypothetical protein